MFINGKWLTEPELEALIKKHQREKKVLKEFLSSIRSYYGETESWVDLYEERYNELIGGTKHET